MAGLIQFSGRSADTQYTSLHSTMAGLIRLNCVQFAIRTTALHSTMAGLILAALAGMRLGEIFFTFHYGRINTADNDRKSI